MLGFTLSEKHFEEAQVNLNVSVNVRVLSASLSGAINPKNPVVVPSLLKAIEAINLKAAADELVKDAVRAPGTIRFGGCTQ